MIAPTPGPSAPPPEDQGRLDRYKEFWLTSLAVDHATSVLVLFVLVALGGIWAYTEVPKESMPEIELPMIAVNTVYPGVAPADVETLISRPIEEELSTISDIEELTSTSIEGYSSVLAEFSTDVDLEEAIQKVREKVDLAKPELPDDAEEPQILEFNFSEAPIMQVSLSGEYGLVRLKELGEDLQDELENIPSVLRVDLRGGREREVRVDVDLAKLKFYNIAFDDLLEAIREENVNIPGGAIDVGDRKYLVRVDGEFDDPAAIGDLVVSVSAGRPVYVRDVATVDFGFADRESFARLDGAPVVTLDVVKRSGENILETSAEVEAVIERMVPGFPPSTVVKVTTDMSEDIRMMVSSLENNILSGLILIVAVLFFFLGLRTSAFVAIAIPTSMFLSFLVLEVLGSTMNMVVLFSLILALGMLVDNAIVVVENIYRYVEHGWDRRLAAKKATGEVAGPVIAATATTLAAFFPLLFWPGMTGEFMKFLPQTLIVTLSSSLFVALVIVPTLCALFIRAETVREGVEAAQPEKLRRMNPTARWTLLGIGLLLLIGLGMALPLTTTLLVVTAGLLVLAHRLVMARMGRAFQERQLPALVDRYEGALRWSLDHRIVTLVIAVVVLIGSGYTFALFNHGVEYFPEDIPPAQIIVDLEAPEGTRVEFTDAVASRIEGELATVQGIEDVESVVTTVGGTGGGNIMEGGGPSGPHAARITLGMVDFQDRTGDAFATLAWMQEHIGTEIAGAEVSVTQLQQDPSQGAPVNIEVVGEDPVILQDLSSRMVTLLKDSPVGPKLVGLESDMEGGRPELSVVVDREKAQLYGLSTFDVGQAIRGAVQGVEAAKYRTGNDEYDIVVRLREEDRSVLSALEELTVFNEGTQVPVLSVADWQVGEGYSAIRRKDQTRMATISSDVAAGFNQAEVLGEVQATLADFAANEMPTGYTISYTGQSEEQEEAMAFLTKAFLIALSLIGMILVSQFNSVIKPVIILTSVIMSTSGVMLGLVLFNMPFVVIMTGVGIISLAGIVVNNAIVLIDYIDILRDRDGMDRREALVQGGKTRMRPVVLTAITTALGLIPLAIGLNFDFFGLYGRLEPDLYWGGDQAAWWGPMAIAVIVGILFATVLTLILVPVMYALVDDFTHWFRRTFLGETAEEAAAALRGSSRTGQDPVSTTTGPGAGAERPEPELAPAYMRPGSVGGSTPIPEPG